MNGAHDLTGLLVQGVGAPVRVEQVQLLDQPVVFPQEERVQRDHAQMLVGSGIPCEVFIVSSSSSETCRAFYSHFQLTSLKAGRGVPLRRGAVPSAPRGCGGVSGAAGVQVGLQARQEGHVGQLLVPVLGVEGHGAQRGGEVPQSQGQAGGAAVNHTGVHKGGDGVELLSVSMGQDSGDAAGR